LRTLNGPELLGKGATGIVATGLKEKKPLTGKLLKEKKNHGEAKRQETTCQEKKTLWAIETTGA